MSRTLSLAAVAGLLAGCGTAHVIYQAGNVGTIELSGDQQKAMVQANEEMTTVCGAGNASIVAQGYEKGGTPPDQRPPAATAAEAGQDGMVMRIHFQCGAPAPAAPAAPVAAQPPA